MTAIFSSFPNLVAALTFLINVVVCALCFAFAVWSTSCDDVFTAWTSASKFFFAVALQKDDALGVAQQAAKLIEAEQMKLADARKAETKKHSGELKVLRKQKFAVDNKLQSLKQRVTSMDKQLAKLQEDLRTAISVCLVVRSFILFCPFQN